MNPDTVEIVEVRQQHPLDERLRGCHLDQPESGTASDGPSVTIAGWALTPGGPAIAAELACAGRVVRRVPLGRHRLDLATAFPEVPGAEHAGFQIVGVPVLGEQDYQVLAVLPGQARVPVGSLRLRRLGMVEGPLVSVVIPCYRQARFLGEAIESVLGQSYARVEVVVVDDGSPDNTAAVAARYPGLIYVRQPNAGLSAARNTGLRRSKGDFLVFLDADDRLLPNAVEAGLECFKEHPDCVFVHGHFHLIGSDGVLLSAPERFDPKGEYYLELLRRNYIEMHATVMYRCDIFEKVGGFNERMRSCEDYDLYLRIAREHPVCCHDTVIAEYRRHATNMTNNVGRILRFALAALGRQWKYVRGDKRQRTAYLAGMKFWREVYGEQLLTAARAYGAEGERDQAVRAMLALLRHGPRVAATVAGEEGCVL